jgi:hypothetical protein
MINVLKNAGFKVCRENANLYLKYKLTEQSEIIVFFTSTPEGKVFMTVFERTVSYNVKSKEGINLDYTQDDALRCNSIAVNSVDEIFVTLGKFGYEIASPEPTVEGGSQLNSNESPIKPLVEQEEAKERIAKDIEEMRNNEKQEKPLVERED